MIRQPESVTPSRMPRRMLVGASAIAVAVLIAGCGGSDDLQSDHADPTYGPPISETEAVDVAGGVTSGKLVEVRRDSDRGVLVFDVVTKDADGTLTLTQVAANTGEVLKVERLLPDGRVPSDGGGIEAP